MAAAVAALDVTALEDERWFGAKGRGAREARLVEAFELDDGGPVLALIEVSFADGPLARYTWPLDDDAWTGLARAIVAGRTIESLPDEAAVARAAIDGRPVRPTAALVCRPAPSLVDLLPGGEREAAGMDARPVGADQSNTSVVLGERLILKAFRRIEPGLNPDLEMSAYLAEEAGFAAVARLGGFAEIVSRDGVATVAMLQEFVPGAGDLYEALAERLAGWILAPGEVTVEFATDEIAQIGRLTAALHATLAEARAPGFEPRDATRDEIRAWHAESLAQLDAAISAVPRDVAAELRPMATTIADQFTVFEALPEIPRLTRVHADYHLGQVLEAPDRYVIIDFEGEPTRPLEDRRRHDSPLRDVASMLRSIDHVGRSARLRAERRSGGPLARSGLDVDGWLRRSRERFLDAYRAGLREAGAAIVVDPGLLRAFEFAKECYEFIYAATYLPEWLWAPTEGMRGLVAEVEQDGRAPAV